MPLTHEVAQFIVETSFDSIPESTKRLAKRSILDGIGLALAGQRAQSGHLVRRYLESLGCAGRSTVVGGVRVTAVGEVSALASFPFAQAAPAVRAAFIAQQKHAAFALWLRRRQNQSLASLTCQHDQPPQPASIDLTDWLPWLSLG